MQAVPAWAQKLGQATDDDISFERVFAALLLCLAIAIVAAFVLRGRLNLSPLLSLTLRSSAARLRLVESLRVGNQVHLCIVMCDDEQLLIEVSPQGARILKALAKPARGDQAEPES